MEAENLHHALIAFPRSLAVYLNTFVIHEYLWHLTLSSCSSGPSFLTFLDSLAAASLLHAGNWPGGPPGAITFSGLQRRGLDLAWKRTRYALPPPGEAAGGVTALGSWALRDGCSWPPCPAQALERVLPQVSPCCTSGVSGAAEDGDFTGILGSTHADMSPPGLRLQQGRCGSLSSPSAGLGGCSSCLEILSLSWVPGEFGGHKL